METNCKKLNFKKILKTLLFYFFIPILFSLLICRYLLKEGYSGFVDNGSAAISFSEFLRMSKSPFGFWFFPSYIIVEIIFLFLRNKILSWKLSIIIYHYLSFCSSILSLNKISNLIFSKNKSNFVNIIIYLLSLFYAFNIYTNAGLIKNYFLPQFQIPYIFAPIFFSLMINIYFKLINNFDIKKLIFENILLGFVGFFLVANPPFFILAYTFVFFLYLNIVIYKKNFKYFLLFFLPIIISSCYIFFDIIYFTYINPTQEMIKFTKSKIDYWGQPFINILTFSFKEEEINTKYSIIYKEQIVFPSNFLVYLPFAFVFWSTIIFLNKNNNWLYEISLGIFLTIIIFMFFMNGFHNSNFISKILLNISKILPNIIFSPFINALANLNIVFSFGFILVSILLIYYTKKYPIFILILSLVIILPPVCYYFYVQTKIYSKLLNPVSIPQYYDSVFEFIKQNPNQNYIWIPVYGIVDWRQSFMSNIPLYISNLYDTKINIPKSDVYHKILENLNNQNFPREIFEKNNISFIIFENNYILVNQFYYDTIKTYINTSFKYFTPVLKLENITIYKVNLYTENHDNLLGFWKIDECSGDMIYDYSGYGNNGKINNGVWLKTKLNSCILYLNGNNSYIYIPHSDSLETGETFTISIWLKLNGTTHNKIQNIIRKDREWSLQINNNYTRISFHLQNSSYVWHIFDFNTSPSRIENSWHMFTISKNKTFLKIYVDGELNNEYMYFYDVINLKDPITIAKEPVGYFGKIIVGEIRIYNKSLSSDEVKSLYNESISRYLYE